jgi:uncharacterized protein YidB (DUF937 family)
MIARRRRWVSYWPLKSPVGYVWHGASDKTELTERSRVFRWRNSPSVFYLRTGRAAGPASLPGLCCALNGWTLGNLGGMLGGTGPGGLLSGGIGELLERFNQNGQGETAQSWIDSGPNKEISPQQLKQAIGSDVLEKLEQQTGLSQDELLARLSRELPTAVDKYTPDGRLPAA